MNIPDSIEAFGQNMALVYEWCANRIIINMAKSFPYIAHPEALDAFEWQAAKLTQFGQVSKKTVAIIQSSLEEVPDYLKGALERELLAAVEKVEPELVAAAKAGLLLDDQLTPTVTVSIQRAFDVYYKQAADKLNLVNTVMLDSTEQAYREIVADIVPRIQATQGILDQAAGSVITGVESLNTAMRQAVERMVTNGLTGFVDHHERHWRPEAYVMMDIRTTMMNAARQAAFDRCDDFGSDIIQIDSHAGARPLCYPWQGKLISRTDNSRDVTDISGTTVHVYALSETSYGQAAGLFGINCRHFGTPFIPGFSGLGNPDLIQPKEENDNRYQLTQEQRAMERALREARLQESVAQARGDAAAAGHWFDKAEALSDKIGDFCEANGLPRQREREYTPVNAKWPLKQGTHFPYNVDPYKGNAGK